MQRTVNLERRSVRNRKKRSIKQVANFLTTSAVIIGTGFITLKVLCAIAVG